MLALSQAHSCPKEIVDRHAHHSNLILMHEYKLSFNIEVKKSDGSDSSNNIETLIISRKNVSAWKKTLGIIRRIMLHYSNNWKRINDIFRPSISDAYAFILNNRTLVNDNQTTKSVDITMIHSWKLEIKESQLNDIHK